MEAWAKSLGANIDELLDQDKNIAEFAFERYTRTASFIGTPQTCLAVANQLQGIGVNEIACLINWMDADNALKSLPYLKQLYDLTRTSLNLDSLRTYLSSRLPEYMAPAAFVQLEALPLTPNGKLDRKALPTPEADAYTQRTYEPPQGEMEEVLANLWQELLGVERVGRHDDFFELGGHSLLSARLVSQIRAQFGAELRIRDVFETPQLSSMAVVIEQGGGRVARPRVVAVGREADCAPVSFEQRRLWFIDQLGGGSAQYNMPGAVWIRGRFDEEIAERVLRCIIQRHEALRTVFLNGEDGPLQRIQAAPDFHLRRIDLSGLSREAQEQVMREELDADALKPFDLSADLMLRASFIRLSGEEGALLFNMHHIASDGWSMGVLVNEFGQLYEAFSQDKPDPLAPLAIQYADYAQWQRDWLKGELLERQLSYWEMRLTDLPEAHEMPLDRPRPAAQTFNGVRYDLEIEPSRPR